MTAGSQWLKSTEKGEKDDAFMKMREEIGTKQSSAKQANKPTEKKKKKTHIKKGKKVKR